MPNYLIDQTVNKNKLMKAFAEGKPLGLTVGIRTVKVLINSLYKADDSNQCYHFKGFLINDKNKLTIPVNGWFRTDHPAGIIRKDP